MKLFVEELLRWESPGQFLMRQATPDVEISGTIIPAGALVMVRCWRVRK
ncbi:MAG: cytochrome P450 [bacterium]